MYRGVKKVATKVINVSNFDYGYGWPISMLGMNLTETRVSSTNQKQRRVETIHPFVLTGVDITLRNLFGKKKRYA